MSLQATEQRSSAAGGKLYGMPSLLYTLTLLPEHFPVGITMADLIFVSCRFLTFMKLLLTADSGTTVNPAGLASMQ